MDILYQLGRATAADLMKELPGEPSDSTVRTQLRVLESKGHVRHEEEGQSTSTCRWCRAAWCASRRSST